MVVMVLQRGLAAAAGERQQLQLQGTVGSAWNDGMEIS